MALYATKLDVMVAAGKLNEFEGFSGRRLELVGKQSGLLRAAVLNSLAYPAKHTLLTLWESREASRAFTHSSELSKLMDEMRPQAFLTPIGPMEAFEVVHRVTGPGVAKTGYLIDQTVPNQPAGNVKAYEEARLKLFELRQKLAKGFVVNVLARFLGGGNRYIVLGGFTDAASEVAAAALPEIVQYFREYGPGVIPISTESREPYEFIQAAGAG